MSPLNIMAKPLTEIITALLPQLVLYLVELCLLEEADVTFGKCIVPSGLCSLSPEDAEPITVFATAGKAKVFPEKMNAGGSSLLESTGWMLTGWVFQ